ncbi:hypothetical protein ACFT2C_25595 [Promicromonospora sp. NPDC057138]|uniref:hypothetical protein n=1 Tax=Promicromonospora sp. NPDC057138 TaxID=3346031 RepID=UPI003628E099
MQLTEDDERDRLRGYGYDDDYVEFGMQLATDPPDAAGIVLPTVEAVTGRPEPSPSGRGRTPSSFRTTP